MKLYVTLFFLFIGCSSQPTGREPVNLIVAGARQSLHYLPHVIAEQTGIYRGLGLDVRAENTGGGTKALQALLGGSSEVVMGFFDHPIRMNSQGRGIRAFVTLTRYPVTVLLVSQSAPRIRRIEDLKGATIGVPDMGSAAHHFLNAVLIRHGLTPAEVNPIPLGNQANGIAALERGRVDVLCAFEPGVTAYLRRHPGAVILADTRTGAGLQQALGVPEYPGSTLYSTNEWLSKRPETARKLAKAMQNALRWIQEHPPEEIAAIVPAELQGPDKQLYLQALRNFHAAFSPDGVMSPEGAKAAFDALKSAATDPSAYRFDPQQTYTNTYVTPQ